MRSLCAAAWYVNELSSVDIALNWQLSTQKIQRPRARDTPFLHPPFIPLLTPSYLVFTSRVALHRFLRIFRVHVCLVERYGKVFDVRMARLPKTLRDGFSITRRRRRVVKSSYRMALWRTFPSRLTSRGMRDFGMPWRLRFTESKWLLWERCCYARTYQTVRTTRFIFRAILRILSSAREEHEIPRGNLFMSETFICILHRTVIKGTLITHKKFNFYIICDYKRQAITNFQI